MFLIPFQMTRIVQRKEKKYLQSSQIVHLMNFVLDFHSLTNNATCKQNENLHLR